MRRHSHRTTWPNAGFTFLVLLLLSVVSRADDGAPKLKRSTAHLVAVEDGHPIQWALEEDPEAFDVATGMCVRPGWSPLFPNFDEINIWAIRRADRRKADVTFQRHRGETPEEALVRVLFELGLDSPFSEASGQLLRWAGDLWSRVPSSRSILAMRPDECSGPGLPSYDRTWLQYAPRPSGFHPVAALWSSSPIGNGHPDRANLVDADPTVNGGTIPCGLTSRSHPSFGVRLYSRNVSAGCSGVPDGRLPWNAVDCPGSSLCMEPPAGPIDPPPTVPDGPSGICSVNSESLVDRIIIWFRGDCQVQVMMSTGKVDTRLESSTMSIERLDHQSEPLIEHDPGDPSLRYIEQPDGSWVVEDDEQ